MIKNISILGSTGSIGTQALDVVDKLNLNVVALTASKNIELLEQEIELTKNSITAIAITKGIQILTTY